MRRARPISLALAALAATFVVAGCGSSDNETSVKEGAPLHLGDLSYNVVISRPMNPSDVEDKDYLQGAPSLPNDQFYLGIFIQIHNSGDSSQNVPTDFKVIDTAGDSWTAVPLHNPFALDLGSPIGGGGSLPSAESAAANGPIGGSLVLFLVDQTATENRPLELEVPSTGGEAGRIELDL
jgi:hypothetical protein